MVDLELYDLNPFSDAFLVSGALEGETQSPLWSSGKLDPPPPELWKGVFKPLSMALEGWINRLSRALEGGVQPPFRTLEGDTWPPLWSSERRGSHPFFGALKGGGSSPSFRLLKGEFVPLSGVLELGSTLSMEPLELCKVERGNSTIFLKLGGGGQTSCLEQKLCYVKALNKKTVKI